MVKKVIMDVDTGNDDAVALLLALFSPEVELIAVTTVAGNAPVEYTTDNTLKILDCAGVRDDFPVGRGMARPLAKELVTAVHIHGGTGLGGVELPPTNRKVSELHAVELLIKMIMESEEKVTLVPVGPLTNIALAIMKEPRILENIEEMIIMGGAINDPGNVTPAAEFNIFVDPHAAKFVFHSGAKITLVPLDVTMKTMITREQLEAIVKADNIVEQFTSAIILRYMERYKQHIGIDGCPLHDALALALAFDKSLVKTRRMYVDVETTGEITLGKTVADYWMVTGKEPNMEVAIEVDAERFVDLIFRRLIAQD